MKKLEALLKGKLEEKRVENKVKRVKIALDSAKLNFQSQKDEAELKLDECLEAFCDKDCNVECAITNISNTLDCLEEANAGLERIDKITKLLFEEVAE